MTDPASNTELTASCRDLLKLYRTRTSVVRALEHVDLDVQRGRILAVFGPSGSGKSSLARILAAIDMPDRGEVTVDGLEVTSLRPRARRRLRRSTVAFVFADPGHNLLPYLDSLEHVELSLHLRGKRDSSLSNPSDILELLGLGHRIHHQPAQLSGGEQQRLAIAAAVSGNPSLLVLDEPTAELDRASAETLLGHITGLRDGGTTFVISSHDPAVKAAADEVVELQRGHRVK